MSRFAIASGGSGWTIEFPVEVCPRRADAAVFAHRNQRGTGGDAAGHDSGTMNAHVFGQPHDPQHAASALDAPSSSAGQPSPASASDYDIALPDGRRLAIAEFGTPHGVPVLYFHGFPASRLEAAPPRTRRRSRRAFG